MNVAFIGSVGIPNCYGGFESFLQSVTPILVGQGHEVFVTCDSARYKHPFYSYLGVKRVMVNIRANGALSPIHDLFAFLSVFRRAQYIVVLGVSAGPLFIFMRLMTCLARKKLIINIDGVEWRRGKYNSWQKKLLFCFDFLAQLSANCIVFDNEGLRSFIHHRFLKKAVLIAYPGDSVIRASGITVEPFTALTICRVEPENNLELIIEGALSSSLKKYTIIGNWQNSPYGRMLRSKYLGNSTLQLLDPVYDANTVAEFRSRAALYLHGHSVGGTNPSLVEMLSYSCHLLCFDCVFNRETIGADALYFNKQGDLVEKINSLLEVAPNSSRALQERYHSSYIAEQYIQALLRP